MCTDVRRPPEERKKHQLIHICRLPSGTLSSYSRMPLPSKMLCLLQVSHYRLRCYFSIIDDIIHVRRTVRTETGTLTIQAAANWACYYLFASSCVVISAEAGRCRTICRCGNRMAYPALRKWCMTSYYCERANGPLIADKTQHHFRGIKVSYKVRYCSEASNLLCVYYGGWSVHVCVWKSRSTAHAEII